MSATYNLRSLPNGWQVNKFDDDFNLESSYEMTLSDGEVRCGCPAGQRPSCRHRQMFPMLQTRVDSAWFLDFDTRAWVDPTGEASSSTPEGTTVLVLDDPVDIHNTIAEAVGEPEAIIKQPDSHPFRRRM